MIRKDPAVRHSHVCDDALKSPHADSTSLCLHALFLWNFLNDGATAHSRPRSPHYPGFTITNRHTKVGRTPLDE